MTLLSGAEAYDALQKEPSMNYPVITVVFDNNPYKKGVQSGWGFSCLIGGVEKPVLFDTGAEGRVLLENMEKLGITPEGIDILLLSHAHSDHTGGAYALLEKNDRLRVYLPTSFPESFKRRVKAYGAALTEVNQPMEIAEGVYSTGEMDGGMKEQSLILRTPKGMVIITGCAHPGIVTIVKSAKALFGDEVLFVMGGFHLHNKSSREIKSIISEMQRLEVRYVAPCHCSGDKARALFREAYGEHYIPVGAGKIIDTKVLQ
jgi:7,8-dihydropterin-6-yl-methyl-4-(beta-D-ribofuranosyl)aminobenzene 5'-phosphate synthase